MGGGGRNKRKKKKTTVAQKISHGAKSPMSLDSEDESLDFETQSEQENFKAMKELLGKIKEYEALLRQVQRTRFENALQHEKTSTRLQLEDQKKEFEDLQRERDQKIKARYEKRVAGFKQAYRALREKNQELRKKLSNFDSNATLSSSAESEPFGFTMPLTPIDANSSISPLTESTETFTDSMQDFESGSFVSAVNSPEYLALKAQAKKLETPVGKQKKGKKKTKKQKARLAANKNATEKCNVCRKKDAKVLVCSGFLCKTKTHLECVNEQDYRTFPDTEDWYCTRCRLQQQYAKFLESEDSFSS